MDTSLEMMGNDGNMMEHAGASGHFHAANDGKMMEHAGTAP